MNHKNLSKKNSSKKSYVLNAVIFYWKVQYCSWIDPLMYLTHNNYIGFMYISTCILPAYEYGTTHQRIFTCPDSHLASTSVLKRNQFDNSTIWDEITGSQYNCLPQTKQTSVGWRSVVRSISRDCGRRGSRVRKACGHRSE